MFVLEVYVCVCFFFFKQKTAYEMRISDWSSDVCSSDLPISKWVIPDQIDMPQTGTAAYLNPGERYELSRLRAFVAAHPEALHCVWFGKSQGNMAGFSHLDAAVVHLRHFARHTPVTFTVLHNSRPNYLKSRRPEEQADEKR